MAEKRAFAARALKGRAFAGRALGPQTPPVLTPAGRPGTGQQYYQQVAADQATEPRTVAAAELRERVPPSLSTTDRPEE